MRGIASIVVGSAAGQGLVVLTYPLLTRLYDPSEFGLLTVFTAVVGLIAVAATGALESAIQIPGEDDDAAAVAWAALAFLGLTSLLTAGVGLVAGSWLARMLGVPALTHYWWLLVLTLVTFGTYQILSDWMVRDRSYGALGRRNLLQGVGQVATQAGLGAAGVRPLGLLLGLGVGRLCALGGLVSRRGLLRRARPGPRAIWGALARFRRFPLIAMPSNLLNAAGINMPLLLVSALYGDARAGLLGLTVRVIASPAAVIGQAVNQVFTGESSAALRDGQGTLGATVRGSVARLLLLGAVPATALLLAGPALFGFVFGPEWVEAGQFARFLALAYLGQFAVLPVSTTLFLLERQERELAWAGFRLLLTAGGPVVCGVLGAPVATAVITLAAAHLISYVALYVLCVRAADASDADSRRRQTDSSRGE